MQHLTTLIRQLHASKVHFVLCKKSKAAITPRWQDQPPTLKEVLKHVDAGGMLGFIPGRSNILVIDIDKFPNENLDAIPLIERLHLDPIVTIKTRRGLHLYFKLADRKRKLGNRTWSVDGFSGEIRADRGYVIAWSPPQLVAALDRLAAATPTADSLFPKGGRGHKGVHPANTFTVPGNRNNALNELIFRKAALGQIVFNEERATAIASGLEAVEVDATIKSASEAATSRTFPRKDATTMEAVFEQLGWQTRYNLRSMRGEWSTDNGTTWASTTDRMEQKYRRIIAETFSYRTVKEGKKIIRPLIYGRDSWDEHLGAILADNEVDPFRLWLEGLEEWDGTKRLHRLLIDLFKAEDSPLNRWASTALILGPIQRTYEPGCKLDEIVILVGKQGVGKSSLLSNLLPASEPDWFSDSLSMTDNLQKRVEALQGRVLVELSDLQGFTKADMQSMKAFITRRDDGSVRLSFRRNPETALRRCVLVGSADRAECLPNDPGGLRRFVPVECREGCDVEHFMAAHRNQLWREGLSQWRASDGGIRANLPRSLMGLQTERAELHRRKDQITEDRVENIESDGPFTFGELCHETKTDEKDGRGVSRLADALRQAGWDKRQERLVSGKRAYLWRRGAT